jgi:hypothetical protein
MRRGSSAFVPDHTTAAHIVVRSTPADERCDAMSVCFASACSGSATFNALGPMAAPAVPPPPDLEPALSSVPYADIFCCSTASKMRNVVFAVNRVTGRWALQSDAGSVQFIPPAAAASTAPKEDSLVSPMLRASKDGYFSLSSSYQAPPPTASVARPGREVASGLALRQPNIADDGSVVDRRPSVAPTSPSGANRRATQAAGGRGVTRRRSNATMLPAGRGVGTVRTSTVHLQLSPSFAEEESGFADSVQLPSAATAHLIDPYATAVGDGIRAEWPQPRASGKELDGETHPPAKLSPLQQSTSSGAGTSKLSRQEAQHAKLAAAMAEASAEVTAEGPRQYLGRFVGGDAAAALHFATTPPVVASGDAAGQGCISVSDFADWLAAHVVRQQPDSRMESRRKSEHQLTGRTHTSTPESDRSPRTSSLQQPSSITGITTPVTSSAGSPNVTTPLADIPTSMIFGDWSTGEVWVFSALQSTIQGPTVRVMGPHLAQVVSSCTISISGTVILFEPVAAMPPAKACSLPDIGQHCAEWGPDWYPLRHVVRNAVALTSRTMRSGPGGPPTGFAADVVEMAAEGDDFLGASFFSWSKGCLLRAK